LIFLGFIKGRVLGIADMVPFVVGQDDAAIHIEAIDLEGRIKRNCASRRRLSKRHR
jgi:hypothetical protein